MSLTPEPDQARPKGRDARQMPRTHAEDTLCNLGVVLDLSMSGIRLRGRKLNPQKTHQLRITCGVRSVVVPAKIMWMHKRKWFTWEMGLKFVDFDTRIMTALEHVVILSRHRRTM